MKQLIQQLENNEAILLMYLAGELEAEDRAQVAQMLQADAQLQGMLAELARNQEMVFQGLAQVDGADGARMTGEHGAAMVRRMLQDRQAAKVRLAAAAAIEAIENADPERRRHWALRTVLYPLASAAMIVVAITMWTRYAEESRPHMPGRAWFDPEVVAQMDEATQVFQSPEHREEMANVRDAENEVVAMKVDDSSDLTDSRVYENMQ